MDAITRAETTALDYEPRNLQEAMALAKALFGSGLLPKTIKSPQDLLVIMMTGRELGLSTMQAVRSIWVLDGKPQLSADLLTGLVKRHRDVCEWFTLEEQNGCAIAETKRVGSPRSERFTYTLEDAKIAKLLTKDNWQKHPKDMLLARVAARAARKVYPDLVANMYLPDELEEVPQEKEINAPPPVSRVDQVRQDMTARGLIVDVKEGETEEAAAARQPPVPEPVTPRLSFGLRKGEAIQGLPFDVLSASIDEARMKLDESPKAPWAAKLRTNLALLEAEVERREADERGPTQQELGGEAQL